MENSPIPFALRRPQLHYRGFFLCAVVALARPRDPWPPLPEFAPVLYHESFDEIYSYGMTNAEWVVPNYGTLVESWSGYALERAGTVTPFIVPGVDSAGRTNVASEGAFRFWVKPYWSSAPEGKGPGTEARLVELAVVDGKEAAPVWWLQLNPEGTMVSLVSQGDAGPVTLLKAEICWEAGQWHQLVLNYGPKGTALYLDAQLVGEGAGVWKVPPKLAALVWGSRLTGADSIGGELEELATFSRPLEVAFHYHALKDQAALGPISPAEDQALAELRAKWKAEREARGEPEGGGSQMLRLVGSTSECITNVPVYITNIVAWSGTNAGWTVMFDIQGGTNGVLWDIFTTTNLVGSHITNSQWFWLERGHSCSTYQYTNQPEEYAFYILGNTNDADGGGLSDAFEQLVTHTDPNNSADDLLVPLVSVYVTDSVAMEQQPANTARFWITRLGGLMGLPLTVGCQLSGTASNGVDYYLSPVTTTATNVLVHFAPGQTSVEITLAAVNDSLAEGTEYATLTLTTNVSLCEVNSAHASAAAWILEQYTKVYTTVADFDLGVLAGLEAVGSSLTNVDGRLQFKTNLPPQFPFINVACSGRGTVARINTTNGQVVGEYLTAPTNRYPNPSRTTVDRYGNVWVANRADTLSLKGTNYGSITRLGLIIGGTRFSKTNGVYYPDPNGQYVALSNATYNTCIDRDGDGFIRTSRGLADILPWDNPGDVDTYGGVSTAEDEAIAEYVRVASTGTRTIAVDKFNDIWVGGTGNRKHLKVDGLIGQPVPNSVFDPQAGGYGGVIDGLGNLWSSSTDAGVVRLIPPAVLPVTTNHWRLLYAWGTTPYGIAVDPLHSYIWQTSGGNVFGWHTNGTVVTNADGSIKFHYHGFDSSQGIVVATNGHVWVAHGPSATTVGHLNTNGTHLGNVQMRLTGLRGEYFANTNFSGTPALVTNQAPLNFDWDTGSPAPNLPTNYFSARWLGVLEPRVEGEHVLIVSTDAGAAVRLTLGWQSVSSNWWTEPGPYPVELYLTNNLSTNQAYSLKVEYIEYTGEAQVRLSWREPGVATNAVIPAERFQQIGSGPSGVSVDTAGKIWVGNYSSHNAMRIDPNAGDVVVTNGVTNYVGLVDMVVDLGDGSFHSEPFNKAASPYNYSDMTGFNNRIVNPTLQPLKGYWTVIHDSGKTNEFWQRVSWNADLTNGCGMEVWVRASDDRSWLANEPFVAASNNVPLVDVQGRYIEVRVSLVRDDPAKQPVLYDLTLHGLSTSFLYAWLDDAWAYETQDAEFFADVFSPGPLTYQWWVQWPWMEEWEWRWLPGQTNSSLVLSNVDSWVGARLDAQGNLRETLATVRVSNAVGESLWLEPAGLVVSPLLIRIPATNYGSGPGPAQRYPATIRVFDQPTNLASVTVTLWDLSHQRSADLAVLLVSPSGTNIMLMSCVGGTNAVGGANLVFQQYQSLPPSSGPIPSGQTSYYQPSNYGGISSMPQIGTNPPPAGPYSTNFADLIGSNPNGGWKLYIYDNQQGCIGQLSGTFQGTWQLHFTFQ